MDKNIGSQSAWLQIELEAQKGNVPPNAPTAPPSPPPAALSSKSMFLISSFLVTVNQKIKNCLCKSLCNNLIQSSRYGADMMQH